MNGLHAHNTTVPDNWPEFRDYFISRMRKFADYDLRINQDGTIQCRNTKSTWAYLKHSLLHDWIVEFTANTGLTFHPKGLDR